MSSAYTLVYPFEEVKSGQQYLGARSRTARNNRPGVRNTIGHGTLVDISMPVSEATVSFSPALSYTPSIGVVLETEGVQMHADEKRIVNAYDQLLLIFILFGAFMLYNVVTEKFLDRLSASLLLILATSGFIAFSADKRTWRKSGGR